MTTTAMALWNLWKKYFEKKPGEGYMRSLVSFLFCIPFDRLVLYNKYFLYYEVLIAAMKNQFINKED